MKDKCYTLPPMKKQPKSKKSIFSNFYNKINLNHHDDFSSCYTLDPDAKKFKHSHILSNKVINLYINNHTPSNKQHKNTFLTKINSYKTSFYNSNEQSLKSKSELDDIIQIITKEKTKIKRSCLELDYLLKKTHETHQTLTNFNKSTNFFFVNKRNKFTER